MNEQPPADLLRRLKPIPTYRDHPATSPHDVDGVDPQGAPIHIDVLRSAEPALLLFLSAGCLGCRDLWDSLSELRAALPAVLRLAVVTKGPDVEDPGPIAALAGAGAPVVMSTQAYAEYQVGGPPFLVVVDAERVRTEGVAWGLEETLRTTLAALEG